MSFPSRWPVGLLLLALVLPAGCADAPAPAAAPRAAAVVDSAPAGKPAERRSPQAAPASEPESSPQPEERIAALPESAPARVGPARNATFDDIKFEMVKGDPFLRSMLTPAIEALVGQRIRIRGYILPSFQQTGLTQFVLVRDNRECCFGPGAALFDCILVDMKPGRTTDFSIRPVAVEGVFSIRELLGPGGKHLAIYHLEGESVAD